MRPPDRVKKPSWSRFYRQKALDRCQRDCKTHATVAFPCEEPLPLTRNSHTGSLRVEAWAPSCSLLEAISSLPAADCSVTAETPWMAFDTSWALAACCMVAVAISAIFAAVSSAALMICFSDSPVWC